MLQSNARLKTQLQGRNDVDFAEFIADLRIIEKGGKPDFKKYNNTDCRKSLCWANKTRKAINSKWMIREAEDQNILLL